MNEDDAELVSSQDSVKSLYDIETEYGDILFDYMVKVKEYVDKYPNHSLNSIKSKFKKVKFHKNTISRFRDYLARAGNRLHNVKLIKEYMISRFDSGREHGLAIHDSDLKRWAIQKARLHGQNDFKASKNFISNFKKEYRLVGRKITNFVTSIDISSEKDIQIIARKFVEEIVEEIPNYHSDFVINGDHSGFNYDYVSNRTISYLGEKKTVAIVNSKKRYLTHIPSCQSLLWEVKC